LAALRKRWGGGVSKNSVAKGKYFGPLNTKGAHIKCCAIGEICSRIFRIFKRKGQLDFSHISSALFYHFALKVCEEKKIILASLKFVQPIF
jgi:hypothetical protein